MGKRDLGNLPPERRLATLRIIWAALLIGPLSFLFAVLWGAAQRPKSQPQPSLFIIECVMFAIAVPIGFVIRRIIFNRGMVDGKIKFQAFSTGNIVFWACCESIAFFGIIAAVQNGSLMPTCVPAFIAMACQAITFPTGEWI